MPSRFCLIAGLLLFVVACNSGGQDPSTKSTDNDRTSPNGSEQSPDEPTSDNTAKSSPITVAVKTAKERDELIAAHKGKVVVVDLWATW